MAKKITPPFIRVHEHMPEHPKVEPLSDKAFRVLVETWCWSKRTKTDGRVPDAVWRKRATPKIRTELADAGLIEDDGQGGVLVHDYDDWQTLTHEMEAVSAEKRDAGALGAHERWHVKKQVKEPGCAFCYPKPKAVAGG